MLRKRYSTEVLESGANERGKDEAKNITSTSTSKVLVKRQIRPFAGTLLVPVLAFLAFQNEHVVYSLL